MTFAKLVLQYFDSIELPRNLPEDIIIMNPYQEDYARKTSEIFYQKFYGDVEKRHMCFGINPGRFGAGVTGVPFTDPIRLEEICLIKNDFKKRQELSSLFIYDMIHEFGGPSKFYQKFFISSVSPLGFVQNGINLNYYDIPDYRTLFGHYAVQEIRKQFDFGIHRDAAFSIGKGKNFQFLKELNKEHNLFDRIIPLSHPRWVMQYRLKRKSEFINEYLAAFASLEEGG